MVVVVVVVVDAYERVVKQYLSHHQSLKTLETRIRRISQ